MVNQWELKRISFNELEEYKLPPYQRLKINRSKINGIRKILENEKIYTLLPIVVSTDNMIIDGGHRSKAYMELYKQGNVTGDIWALVDKQASKNTFVQLNMGSPVSIAHKLYISDNIEKMRENGFLFTEGISTKVSIGVTDFARALFIYKTDVIFKQSSASVLIDFINNLTYDEITKGYRTIYNFKEKYTNCLNVGQRFLQKHFLYITLMEKRGIMTEKDYARVVPRLPNSLGGDIGLTYNKNIFIECFNFGKKKNRIDMSIFENKKENNE